MHKHKLKKGNFCVISIVYRIWKAFYRTAEIGSQMESDLNTTFYKDISCLDFQATPFLDNINTEDLV